MVQSPVNKKSATKRNKTQQITTKSNNIPQDKKTMLQQIIHHLAHHPNNSISIEFNGRKKMNPNVATGKYLFTKSIIESGWNTIELFLKGLQKEGFSSGTKVYLRVPNGTTSKIVGEPIILQFSTDIPNDHHTRQTMNQTTTNNTPSYPTGHSYYGLNGGMMGVHPSESKLEAIGAKYEDLKERYDDLKSEYKDIKSTVRQLKEENNSLKLEVNTAEKHKELAIIQAQLSQKTFMDSAAMKSLAENLAPVLPQMISGQPAQIGMGATTANLSKDKKQFIDFIVSDKVADQDVNFVYKLYKNIVKNTAFAEGIQGLLTQFNIT